METPNKWLIIEVSNKEELLYKVFGTWSGGYLDGDSWRLNSGIDKVECHDEYYLFHGFSGSIYKCSKKGYGVAGGSNFSVLNNLITRMNSSEGVEVRSLSEKDAVNGINQVMSLDDEEM